MAAKKKVKKITKSEFLEIENHRLETEIRRKEVQLENRKKEIFNLKKQLLQAEAQNLNADILLADNRIDNIKQTDKKSADKRLEIIHGIQKRLKLPVCDSLGYDPETLEVE